MDAASQLYDSLLYIDNGALGCCTCNGIWMGLYWNNHQHDCSCASPTFVRPIRMVRFCHRKCWSNVCHELCDYTNILVRNCWFSSLPSLTIFYAMDSLCRTPHPSDYMQCFRFGFDKDVFPQERHQICIWRCNCVYDLQLHWHKGSCLTRWQTSLPFLGNGLE